jgi:hypothetical protein
VAVRFSLVVAGSLSLVALTSLSALARTSTLADYEIATSEGGDSKGTLTVGADYAIVRRVTYADTSVHTYSGTGQLSGATLTVRFEGSGEPRDLSGTWTVKGETESGTYHGTASFGFRRGKWVAKYQATLEDESETTGPIELSGKWDGLTLLGERRGLVDGDTAALRSASYTLSPDGLVLTAAADAASRETFTRARLPAPGTGPTATYLFEEGGRLTGTLSNGVKDRGAKVVNKPATTDTKAKVEADPVPSSLRAIRDTNILKAADKNAAPAKAVKRNELVPVCGRENGFWVVGPFKEPGQRRGWKGYLAQEDVDNRLSYADVPAPIFLADRPPSAESVVQKDLGTCYLDAALMAIASVQSRSIETMIRDHEDGTVSVRFFERAGGSFGEHWVRIQRTIIVDERGRSHYTVGEGGQLWPALIEKAFAAWRGQGWYRNIEGGNAADVFEVVLGLEARSRGWNVPVPAELGQGRGGRRGRNRDVPSLGPDDQKAIAAYRETDAAKKETAALENNPAARRDLAYLDAQLELAKKAGLSEGGAKSLHDYYAARVDGPLGSGKYGPQAREVFDQIKASLAAHLPVCMSTRSWGTTAGTGPSGRENVQLVPGLASEHEYMVTGAYEDENHLAWVKVVNPWHRFSRLYEREGDKLVARAANGRQDREHGAFAVELSDVMRYYSSVSLVVGR